MNAYIENFWVDNKRLPSLQERSEERKRLVALIERYKRKEAQKRKIVGPY